MTDELRQDGDVTVLAPSGAIDVSRALELRDVLAAQVSEAGRRVLVDLSGVTLVDSSGIGIFVTAHRQAEAAGSVFALAGAPGPVGRVFELTRTNKLLRIYDTVADGLAALRDD